MWGFIKVPAWGRAWNILLISYSWRHSFWDERRPLRGRRKKDLRVQLLLTFFFFFFTALSRRESSPERCLKAGRSTKRLVGGHLLNGLPCQFFFRPHRSKAPHLHWFSGADCMWILSRRLCLCIQLPSPWALWSSWKGQTSSLDQNGKICIWHSEGILCGCWWGEK